MTTADYLLAHVCATCVKSKSICSYEQQVFQHHWGCLYWTGTNYIPSVMTTATTEQEAKEC